MTLAQPNFEDWMQEKFIGLDEMGGISITKDNCEDLFEMFLQKLDTQELMDWATRYGQAMNLVGQREGLDKASEILKNQ